MSSTQAKRTLWLTGEAPTAQQLWTLDQTRLPFVALEIELNSLDACARAIKTMQVRGAPLIGAVAAFGFAFGVRTVHSAAGLESIYAALLSCRPTAVNLRWAIDQVRASCESSPMSQWASAAWRKACEIAEGDVGINASLGVHGANWLEKHWREGQGGIQPFSRPLNILTHCNAGRLATVAHGTALAPVYELQQRARSLHIWVDETRPRNQGASLTAWELDDAVIPFTVIADNVGGLLMMQGLVDAVIVGCDRVAANGDVANKIGTYLKALAAQANGVPFYVACPLSTVDLKAATGSAIEIEYRSGEELRIVGEVALFPAHYPVLNPAFDITPASLVTGYITEKGVGDTKQLIAWVRESLS